MIEGLVLSVLGAVVTVAIGAPLAAKLARVHIWSKTAPRDQEERRQVAVSRNFEPLDFGPDTMLWPSESERMIPSFPVPPWPSENWTDPDFGRGKAAAQAATQRARDERESEIRRQQQRAERRAADEAAAEQQRLAKQQRQAEQQRRHAAQQQRQQRSAQESRQQHTQQAQQKRQAQQARPKKKPTPQQRVKKAAKAARQAASAAPSAGNMPGRQEIEAMIESLGLAGTVQHLMRENNWDFKTAAAWLAKARKR